MDQPAAAANDQRTRRRRRGHATVAVLLTLLLTVACTSNNPAGPADPTNEPDQTETTNQATPEPTEPQTDTETETEVAAEVQIGEVWSAFHTAWTDQGPTVAYFRTSRASSGPVEAVNGEIEAVDRVARGFRNFDNYRTRMLLKTTVTWHTPITPRPRGRAAPCAPATPSFIAQGLETMITLERGTTAGPTSSTGVRAARNRAYMEPASGCGRRG
jgi:hypothetical protein